MSVLVNTLVWLGFVFVWLLCLAGLVLSAVSISGTWLVAAGAVIAAFLRPGEFPGIWTVLSFVVVAGAVEAFEFVAGAWGVKRRGGSTWAGAAAMAGGLVGLALGGLIPPPLLGSLLGMCLGSFGFAFAVEWLQHRRAPDAAHAALGALTGRALVILVKVTATLGMTATLIIGILFGR